MYEGACPHFSKAQPWLLQTPVCWSVRNGYKRWGKKDKKKLLKREKKEKQKVSQMEKQAQLQKNKKQDSEMKEAFTESGSWKTGGHAR